MDGEEDLPVKPTDGIEDQDPIGPLPTAPPEDDSQIESDVQNDSDDPTAGLDDIRQTLTKAADAADANSPDSFTPPNTPDAKPDPFSPPAADPSAPPDSVVDPVPPDELPTSETTTEASAPDFADIDQTQQTLQSFGEQVNAFNDAGGAGGGDYGSAFNGDYGGDSGGNLQDYADANERHAQQQDTMLTEYARRLDDMTRRLELERL